MARFFESRNRCLGPPMSANEAPDSEQPGLPDRDGVDWSVGQTLKNPTGNGPE